MTPTRHVCVDTLEHLESLYGEVAEASLHKEVDYIHPHYRAMIEASPFMVLATSGPGGLDASPRGDAAGFVVVEDEKTLLLPDRRGNNRIDSLRNLLSNPRVGLLFLIPGRGETLRVNGRARIAITPELLTRFAVDGKPPRSVLVIDVESVYFQCARAIVRAALWQADAHPAVALPSIGTILSDLSNATIDGSTYDRALPERIRNTLY
ncbi:MAG: pyridoxamine 5'-phosphate oxidase family protein [Rhodocyclaceae bacterium]